MTTENELISLFKRAAWEIDQREFDDIDPGTKIADLGIDSVALLEIFGEIEDELGVHLPDDKLANVNTLRDLTSLITSCS
jgi:acyl carrier protein